jgi:tetratricopeptide (TPR) repeat protein
MLFKIEDLNRLYPDLLDKSAGTRAVAKTRAENAFSPVFCRQFNVGVSKQVPDVMIVGQDLGDAVAAGNKDSTAEKLCDSNFTNLNRWHGFSGLSFEQIFFTNLAIKEDSLNPEHPDLAASLDNLGALYVDQSQYVKAEPLYARALMIREKSLGSEHPDVAGNLNNIPALYVNQGQYEKAEPLYRRALAILVKALGATHPDVAICLEGFALLFRKLGRPMEAIPLEIRLRAIRTNFEADYTQTARCNPA